MISQKSPPSVGKSVKQLPNFHCASPAPKAMTDCSAVQTAPATDLDRALRESREEAAQRPSAESPRQKGLPVGLTNPDYHCAMNTVLQTLFMLQPLRNLVLGWRLDQLDSFVDRERNDSQTKKKAQFMRELQNVFRRMEGSQFAAVSADSLVETWRSFLSDQKQSQQRDIHELSTRLLENLSEGQDLYNTAHAPNAKDQGNLVQDLFFGKQTEFLPSNTESQDVQDFTSIIVNPCDTLEEALARSFKNEVTVTVNGKKQTEERTSWISKAPKVLLIHENRILFDKETQTTFKNNTPMEFPQDLWIDQFMVENRTVARETEELSEEESTTELTQAIQNARLFAFQAQQPQFTYPQSEFPPDRIEPLSQALTLLHENAQKSARELEEEQKHINEAMRATEFIRDYIAKSRQEQPMYAQYPFSFEQQFCAELDTFHHKVQWRVNELCEKHQRTVQATNAYQTVLTFLKKQPHTQPSPQTPLLGLEQTMQCMNDLTTLSSAVQREQKKRKERQRVGTPPNGALQEQSAVKKHKYTLFSVWVHRGTSNTGHYYAYVKDFATGKWFKMNDAEVSQSSFEDVKKDGKGGGEEKPNASLLVYLSEDVAKTFTVQAKQQEKEHHNLTVEESKKSSEDKSNETEERTTKATSEVPQPESQKTDSEHKRVEIDASEGQEQKDDNAGETETKSSMIDEGQERNGDIVHETIECKKDVDVHEPEGKDAHEDETQTDEAKTDKVQEQKSKDKTTFEGSKGGSHSRTRRDRHSPIT